MIMRNWTFEKVSGGHAFTEGVQWDGSGVLFTDLYNHRILRFDPKSGRTERFFQGVAQGNGLLYSTDGAIYCCEMVGRCISRIGSGGREVVVSEFEGNSLNSPNDITEDRAGRLWFTDPRYGTLRSDMALDHESVYRYDRSDRSLARLTFDTTRPNGLLLSGDERTLYVAQSDYGEAAKREMRAYRLDADGDLCRYRVMHNFFPGRGADGLTLTAEGLILAVSGWRVSGPGPVINVFDEWGRVIEQQRVPAGTPTNICFGGDELGDMYVAAGEAGIYRVADSGYRGHERYRR